MGYFNDTICHDGGAQFSSGKPPTICGGYKSAFCAMVINSKSDDGWFYGFNSSGDLMGGYSSFECLEDDGLWRQKCVKNCSCVPKALVWKT